MDTPLENRLLPGERLLWTGQPGQGIRFTLRDGFLIPFSLLWCGFAIFWESTVLSTPAPGFFALFGIPFVLMGLFAVAGRFVLDAWLRGRTRYALSSQRVLIQRSAPFADFIAISLDGLGELKLTEGAGGRGTIRLGHTVNTYGRYGGAGWMPVLDPTPQFLGVEDARSVFDQIQQARSRARMAS